MEFEILILFLVFHFFDYNISNGEKQMNYKIVLLIDAENTSVKYLDSILQECKQYGETYFRRMYGDFSNARSNEWTKMGLEHAIVPIHQTSYTQQKNASDIMMVIDAMDILYQSDVDCFCIVTSDSDFTRLANRLREGGNRVIGMGKSDASKTFISACNEYKFLDKIIEDENENADQDSKSAITSLAKIKDSIHHIIQQAEGKGELANLGSTKSQLQREFADFDERNYGYSSFRKFIEEETNFSTKQVGSTVSIVRKKSEVNEKTNIKNYVLKCAKNQMLLDTLGRNLYNHFPSFNLKEMGYSKLSKYIESFDEIEIITKNNRKYVAMKNRG